MWTRFSTFPLREDGRINHASRSFENFRLIRWFRLEDCFGHQQCKLLAFAGNIMRFKEA